MKKVSYILAIALFLTGCTSTIKLPDAPQALVDMLIKTNDEFYPEQAKAAYKKLVKKGTAAFPLLIKYSDDKRLAWPGLNCWDIMGEATVGMVCSSIISGQVGINLPKGYRNALCFLGTWPEKSMLKKWWKERSDWTLKEMQIEAAKYSIEAAKKWEGFRNEEARQKTIEWFTSRLRELGAEEHDINENK